MFPHFNVVFSDNQITVSKKNKSLSISNIYLFLDHHFIGSMSFFDTLVLNMKTNEPKTLLIHANILHNGEIFTFNEIHQLTNLKTKKLPKSNRKDPYRAGDILVACDNLNGLPYGYMGHSAIVVDEKYAVEAVMINPIVRKIPIESFTNDHSNRAHFRPLSKEMGESAANYALGYLKKFQENKKMGIKKPVFSFTINTPLPDEWTYIYCSKLVWLSYYYGCKYAFINDHLWFAPEDLYSNLKDNPDFELIYIHPDFKFHLDL